MGSICPIRAHLITTKKERGSDRCHREYAPSGRTSVTEGHTACDSVYMEMSRTGKTRRDSVDWWLTGAGRGMKLPVTAQDLFRRMAMLQSWTEGMAAQLSKCPRLNESNARDE
jgi:hypothetical protein